MLSQAELFRQAYSRGVYLTIVDLWEALNICEGGLLDKLMALQKTLDQLGLECRPPISEGELETVRFVFTPSTEDGIADEVAEALEKGECSTIEFKSSLLFDRRRAEHDPGKDVSTYQSEKLVFSVMKTIGGFANADGGCLLIGVQDDGNCCGVEDDYAVLGDRGTADQYELFLRSKMGRYFYDGESAKAICEIRILKRCEKELCYVRVRKAPHLLFMKDEGGNPLLFLRLGNQTERIAFSDVEKYFRLERL